MVVRCSIVVIDLYLIGIYGLMAIKEFWGGRHIFRESYPKSIEQ